MIAIRTQFRTHTLILLIIALIGVYRVALTPVGQDFGPDKIRFHRTSEVMLDALAQGNFHDFDWSMYAAQGRPTITTWYDPRADSALGIRHSQPH